MLSQKGITLIICVMCLMSAGNVSWSKMFMIGLCFVTFMVWTIYKNQEKFLYQPRIYPQFATPAQNPPGYKHPGEHDMPYEDVYLTTPDGLKLHAWFIHGADAAETKSRPTLLFFHANAGNMGFRLQNLKVLHSKLHINIFILSYRGYGASEGEPGEAGFLIDAETAWQHLIHRPDVDINRILVFGRSMGGAVAIAHTAKHDKEVKGLILENTFSCISDMADQLFPILKPLKPLILRLDWNSVGRIPSITTPILFFSGLLDEVVPPQQMARLHRAATGSKDRKLVTIIRGQHNDTWLEGGADYVKAFARFVHTCTGFLPPCIDPDSPISHTLAASLPPPPSAANSNTFPGAGLVGATSTSPTVTVSAEERARLIANLRASIAKSEASAGVPVDES